jgi:hypothetical protein
VQQFWEAVAPRDELKFARPGLHVFEATQDAAMDIGSMSVSGPVSMWKVSSDPFRIVIVWKATGGLSKIWVKKRNT